MTRYSPILLILILMIIAAGAAVADKIICDYCKQEIKSQYIEANGKYYHPIHFKCDNCGTVIGNGTYYRKDGKHYCEKCYLELFGKKCAHCGQVIKEEYIIYEGKEYHRTCFEKYIAVRCTICGEVIDGEYIEDNWGNRYCKKHEKEYNSCEYCGRLITDPVGISRNPHPDGRYVCMHCRKTAINTQGQALKLFREIRLRLQNVGIEIKSEDIELHLVNKNELREIAGARMVDPSGYTWYNYSTVAGQTASRKFDLYVLDCMPEEEFIIAAAHELMHVWQYERSNKDKDRAFCEGSCNFAAYLVLEQLTGDEVRYTIRKLEDNTSPDYGDGFRRVKKMVEDKGVTFWLNHLEADYSFPEGY